MNDKLRERLLVIAPAIGYPFLYVVCLIVFASWTFPFDKVRDRVVAGFNESQRSTKSSHELAIAEMGSSWVTGLKLTGVRLIDHDAPRDGSARDSSRGSGDGKSEIKIESLVARVALLPMLIGRRNISFHADVFGGSLDGAWKENGKDEEVEVTLEAIDFGQVTPLTQMLEVPMEGTLGGTFKLELPEGKLMKANGTVAFEAEGVSLGDGKAKLMGKVAVPRLSLGAFSLTGDVKDGTVKITKLGASGRDVDFLADARIPLRDAFLVSQVDANIRFRVSDGYKNKNDDTKALFGATGSTMPGLIDLDPRMKQAKRADGFYTWRARGALGKLDFSPGGTGGPASGPGGSGGSGPSRPKGNP